MEYVQLSMDEYTVSRMDFIGTGKVGIVYNYKYGVQDKVLTPGMHFIAPMNKQ